MGELNRLCHCALTFQGRIIAKVNICDYKKKTMAIFQRRGSRMECILVLSHVDKTYLIYSKLTCFELDKAI